jgi:hypothetical protein
MSDDPVYTGWVQAQFSGDIDRAKTFMHEARRVLGALLSAHGINAKVEAGEPSGFAKTYRQYPDGTRVTAWHNNGHNTIRVDTPTPKQPGSVIDVGIPTSESWEGKPGSRVSHTHYDPSHVDVPHLTTSRPDDEEEEKKNPNGYYMWVGLRSTNANVPYYTPNGCMIEPKVEGKPRGILNSDMYWGVSSIDMNSDGSVDEKYGSANFGDAVADDFNTYATAAFNNYPGFEYGDHCTSVRPIRDINTEVGFLASANGLICQPGEGFLKTHGEGLRNVIDEGQEGYMQYDPLAKNQDGSDRPETGNREAPGILLQGDPPLPYSYVFPTPPLRNWDVTWELDPDPFEFPGDTREWKVNAIEALEKNCGMAMADAKILPGLYMLTANASGQHPYWTSSRAGKPIPGSNFDPKDPLGERSGTSDYDQYMHQESGIKDTHIQIEIRLGKGAEMNIFKFESVIASADGRTYAVSPFGDGFTYDECAKEGGPNPFGPNFMHPALAIDVMGGTAGWADEFKGATVEPIFGGGTYGIPGDERKRLYLCMYGAYFASQPGDEAWAEYAGYAAFKALEDATSGMYGQMLFTEMSEGALAGIFAGGDRTKVNILDCYSGELTVQPLINGAHDYDPPFITNPDGSTTNSPYLPYFQWYYPYRVLIKAQCHNSLGIVVMADKEGWVLQTGQTRGGSWGSYPGDPDPPDCCT